MSLKSEQEILNSIYDETTGGLKLSGTVSGDLNITGSLAIGIAVTSYKVEDGLQIKSASAIFESGAAGGTAIMNFGRNVYSDSGILRRLVADNDCQLFQLGTSGNLAFFTQSDAFTSIDSAITFAARWQITRPGTQLCGGQTCSHSLAGNGDVILSNLEVNNLLYTDSGRIAHFTNVAASTYSTLTSDHYIGVSYTATGICTVTLQTATVTAGRVVTIKDTGGNASGNNITIATQAAQTIDGAATQTISGDYDSVDLFSDGTNWFIK